MKKAIIFDFFGVICSEAIPMSLQQNFPGVEVPHIYDAYIQDAERGVLTEQELLARICTIDDRATSAIRSEWKDYFKINAELVALIKQIKPKYRIGLCTNALSSFLNPVLDRCGLRELFDGIVISDTIHHVKPEPEMYLAILEKLDVEAKDALFVDDQEVCIEAAETCGIEGILFRSVDQLAFLL